MKNNNAQLAVIDSAVKPKPTKTEIIEAMAIVKLAELKKAREEEEATKEVLNSQIDEAVRAHVSRSAERMIKAGNVTHSWFDKSLGRPTYIELEIRINARDIPESIAKLHQKLDAVKRVPIPDISIIKRQIRSRMAGLTPIGDRANILAQTCESQLKKMLKSLE